MQTSRTIGVIGVGAMGAGLGRLFGANGARVLTPLDRRSEQSRLRAADAGLVNCGLTDLALADLVLSVVPPANCEQVARDFASMKMATDRPLFIDSNAVSPGSKRMLEKLVIGKGGRFVDGVLIGRPPGEGCVGPRLYVCGEYAEKALVLRDLGLDVRVIEGPTGTAAALKMCYGGLNKGITALTTAVLLAAQRSGVDEALLEEFAISQQSLLERSRSTLPSMYPKAFRWVAEFDEIAAFAEDDPLSAEIFSAIARFYEDRAAANEQDLELPGLLALLQA